MNILTQWFLFFIHETVIKTDERRQVTNFRLCNCILSTYVAILIAISMYCLFIERKF
jgi:hypothetical protein